MKTLFTSCFLIVSTSALLTAGDWPQWRGPQRDGRFTGPAWPDKLTDAETWAHLAVAGEQVFVRE